ncbi:hypothetical protein H310_02695 [Aphanomyces invadans]|uniref:Uncharacterized protein n=1 Tax=Aphanomyces invadans TaxID=157072 RepID=A0A024UJI9_9STRA|nr:hypothetical protein H310_02695 [Aphanomyces invadans]ETW06439.1 hypothetical protein H310_02695 [Aphanomyces invadans]|eukprot:XP_008864514.1 hypothetical protein H310_02695 [Aphanomyces invadans]
MRDMTALSDDLSSAICFVMYGMGSFWILTAWSTVLKTLYTLDDECSSHVPANAVDGRDACTLWPVEADDDCSTDLPNGDGAHDDTEPPHVPYLSLMPKHTTLQEHHALPSSSPVYTCVCQLPVAIPVSPNSCGNARATATSYPNAKTIRCEPLVDEHMEWYQPSNATLLTRAATLYDTEDSRDISRCRSASCPVTRRRRPACTLSSARSENPPLKPVASPKPAKPAPPIVLVALTAQVDTSERREKSLHRATFQVGLPLTSLALGDVYSIRVELSCPDNEQSHPLPSVMWCFTSTVAEMNKTRQRMQHEVHEGDASCLTLEIESREDMQRFLDTVVMLPRLADAPSLRKFCQMW